MRGGRQAGARLQAWLTDRFELGPAEANRLLPMEGLRGVAVALVFLVHYATLIEPYAAGLARPIVAALSVVGHAGVDLFFVLSGYLIYGTLIRRPQPFGAFLRRRIQRLYPVFALILLIYLALSLALPAESKLPAGAWDSLLYVAANFLLLPGIFDIQPIITVAWSLSYEMAFYLTVPLLIGALRLRFWSPRVRVMAFLAASALLLGLGLPHERLVMFACGMVLAETLPALRQWARARGLLDWLALLAVIGYGLALLAGVGGAVKVGLLFLACFLLCAAGFAHHGPVARIMTVRPLRWLGNMSYSYYLVHGLALKAMFMGFGRLPETLQLGEAAFWVLLLPAFGLTLSVAAVLFLLVERPFSILPAERARRAPVLEPATVAASR